MSYEEEEGYMEGVSGGDREVKGSERVIMKGEESNNERRRKEIEKKDSNMKYVVGEKRGEREEREQ